MDFSVTPKLQTIWGFREAIVFFLEGLSVTVFVAFMFLGIVPGMVVGVVLLIAAVLLLLSHLGHPMRAWMAIRNFRRSWVSRGTVMIGAFNGLGIVYIAAPFVLQLEAGTPLMTAIAGLLIFAGVFILAYPGFAMSASPAIPFWSSGLLPVLSAVSGLASGVIVILAYMTTAHSDNLYIGPVNLVWLQQILLIVVALVTFAYLVGMSNSGTAAKLSVAYLVQREPLLFWTLTVGAGLILPILLVAATLNTDWLPTSLIWVAAAARLIGDACSRYAWLKAGIYDAVLQSHRRV